MKTLYHYGRYSAPIFCLRMTPYLNAVLHLISLWICLSLVQAAIRFQIESRSLAAKMLHDTMTWIAEISTDHFVLAPYFAESLICSFYLCFQINISLLNGCLVNSISAIFALSSLVNGVKLLIIISNLASNLDSR